MLRALALPPHEVAASAAVSGENRTLRLSRPVVRGVNWVAQTHQGPWESGRSRGPWHYYRTRAYLGGSIFGVQWKCFDYRARS